MYILTFSSVTLSRYHVGPNPFNQEHGPDQQRHRSADENDDMYQHAALSLLRKVPTSTTAAATTSEIHDAVDDCAIQDMNAPSISWHKRSLGSTTTTTTTVEGGGGGNINIVKHVSFRQVVHILISNFTQS